MTINEIANMAGVSRATVSRYLNNGYVSDEKKERIRQVIEKTGYVPSSFAQTLRNRKTNYIGVIIPKLNSDSISKMVDGISSRLHNEGYQMLLACTQNNESEELNYLNLFKENHVDGIILMGTIFTPQHRTLLKKLSVPFVILGQNQKDYSCIYHDDYQAAYHMGEYLAKIGTHFGLLGVTPLDQAVGTDRKNGYMDALAKYGKHLSNDSIRIAEFNRDSAYQQTKLLFESNPDIDTLLCATDTLASGAMQYLRESGRKVPDDVCIAGFGDGPICQATVPPLTTIHYFYTEAGREAANLLFEQMANPDLKITKSIKLGFQIIENESTKKQ